MKTKALTPIFLFLLLSLLYNKAYAFGECTDYGFMATYDYFTDSCKCMSGYIMDEDLFGNTTCVSGDSVCRDKYGFSSRYDSLSNSCECSYGYVMGVDSIGRTQCISQDELCRNQLGFSSRYNTLYGRCECSYGNVIDNGKCSLGSLVCTRKHGIHANFDSLSNSCECDNDYTFDDYDQCVEKQHNVYFTLIEIDAINKEAIIKSDYDYRYYKVSYGIGCLDITFERYTDKKIVVNLGTDYAVNSFDNIVLQDDDQVCSIIRVSYANASTTLFPEPEELESVSIQTPRTANLFSDNDQVQNDSINGDSDSNNTNALEAAYTLSGTTVKGEPWYQKFFDYIEDLFN